MKYIFLEKKWHNQDEFLNQVWSEFANTTDNIKESKN